MKNIAMLLLVVVAALPLVGKAKQKEKRYDPVRITDVRQLPGRYVGVDPDYVVNLSVSPEGFITGTMRDFGRTAITSISTRAPLSPAGRTTCTAVAAGLFGWSLVPKNWECAARAPGMSALPPFAGSPARCRLNMVLDPPSISSACGISK